MVLLLSLCFKHRNNLERGGMIFGSFWVWDPIIQARSVVAPVVVASSDADRAWELQKLLQAWLLCILLHGFLSFLPPTPPFNLEAKSTRQGPSRKSSLGKYSGRCTGMPRHPETPSPALKGQGEQAVFLELGTAGATRRGFPQSCSMC